MITLNSLNEYQNIKRGKITALQAKERELETLRGKALTAQDNFRKAVNEGVGHEKAYKAKQEAERAVEEMEAVVKVYAESAKTKTTATQELMAAMSRVFNESTEMMANYESRRNEIGKQLAELTTQYNDLASEYMGILDHECELEALLKEEGVSGKLHYDGNTMVNSFPIPKMEDYRRLYKIKKAGGSV